MVVWSDQVNAKFLITTLQQVTPQVSREVWKKVAEIMGEGFTAEACRQNYAKLLKAQGTASTPATPGPATPVKATPKSGGRKRKDAAASNATPSKSASAKKQKKDHTYDIFKTEEEGKGLKFEEDVDCEELVVPPTPYKKSAKSTFSDDSD